MHASLVTRESCLSNVSKVDGSQRKWRFPNENVLIVFNSQIPYDNQATKWSFFSEIYNSVE